MREAPKVALLPRSALRILPEIASALTAGRAVVALESAVIAQGLPHPANREAAERMASAIGRHGALPAMTAVVRGTPSLGLHPNELERLIARAGVKKVSARDLAWASVRKIDGATTVAGAIALATLAGCSVFATGGIGGVHLDPAFDESADLVELARTSMLVVCAGAKSILDLPATVERLETLGIPVIGYRTDQLPGFYTAESGVSLDACASSAEEIAEAFTVHRALGRPSAMLVVQPPPADHALPRAVVDHAVEQARAAATAGQVRGGALTPFLLAEVARVTGGRSLQANLALLEANAALASSIAVALATRTPTQH